MDAEITSALITAVSGIIVGSFSLLPAKVSSFKKKHRQEMLTRQLDYIFEPMDKLFVMNVNSTPAQLLLSAIVIIESNYKLVPQGILNKVLTIRTSKEITDSQINELAIIVSSYYNWTRKYLGYPHDPSKIVDKHTPAAHSQHKIWEAVYTIFIMLFIISAIVTFVFITLACSGTVISAPSWIIQAATINTIAGLFYVVACMFYQK